MELDEKGFLKEHNIRLIGTTAQTIKKAEDRQEFKDTMEKIGEPIAASKVVTTVEDGLAFTNTIGYPVVLRPAYTLGGSGGGIAHNEYELREILENGLRLSRVGQVLVERCIAGWKEIEYEVMRDSAGNCITVCNMENIDPVGVHTGDSIVVAPSQTLGDKEYQMLRTSALNIITELGITGGCNVQYALHPESFEYCVIEVNPRSSRTVPFISKVTGINMVECATRIALGESLKDLGLPLGLVPNKPYVAVKAPVFSFSKMGLVEIALGPEMKSTGEVMGIGRTYSEALFKAINGANMRIPEDGTILMTVADRDKEEASQLAKGFIELGYHIEATGGTGKYFKEHGVDCKVVNKISEGDDNCADHIRQDKVDLVLNTLTAGKRPEREGFQLRRLAVEMGTPCLTSLDTAREVLRVVANRKDDANYNVEALQDFELE